MVTTLSLPLVTSSENMTPAALEKTIIWTVAESAMDRWSKPVFSR